jgi:hypothetical protein
MPLYYWCSFINGQKAGPPKQLITNDDAKARAFIEQHNVPGRGVFSCPQPLIVGATRRCIETIDSITTIQADIDFKDLVETAEEVDTQLHQLPIVPTWVRDSGWGRHFVLELKDPIPHSDLEYFERACLAWKRLVAVLNADPACSHPACLFRVKGTINSKHEGEPRLCRDLWGSGQPVDLTEIEALIDLLPATGIFTIKPRPATNGRDTQASGRRREPVDVDQRLADMAFEGPGQSAVHHTELSCTASLLRNGMSLDSAVLTVLEEMQKKLAGDPRTANWVWANEKKALEGQCFDFISKHPELAPSLPDEFRDVFDSAVKAGKKPRFIFNRVHGWQMRALTVVKGGLEANDRSEPPGDPKEDEKRDDDAEAPRYRFKLVPFASLKPGPEPLNLVDELIPLIGLVDVWGKAKCLKSFWCTDLLLHVAAGWEYRDRYVHQGAVVYCAFEGAHGYKKRIEALRRHYAISEDTHIPFYIMPGQANLIAEHRLLISDISAQLGEVKPVAVVLDTLNKSLFGSENRDEDMGAYVRAAEAIRDRFSCVVIIVHHCGWDDTRPRGHSSLPGAVDAQLSVVRSENVVTVTVEMMRDGAENTQVVSKVEEIEVGQDRNGKILTSLVVVPSDERAAYTGSERPPRGVIVLLSALRYARDKHGEEFQPEAGVLAVRAVEQWHVRDRFYATYAESEEHSDTRQNKLRQAWHRALGECQTRGLIRTLVKGQHTMVWEVRSEA